MKIRVLFKDPDVVGDAIDEAVAKSCKELGLDEDETEAVVERRREKVQEVLSTWIKYSEYVCVEFDTEAKTARVVPVKEQGR